MKSYDELAPWQKQIWNDIGALDEKIGPIDKQLDTEPITDPGMRRDQELLAIQLSVMRAYRAILALRASEF